MTEPESPVPASSSNLPADNSDPLLLVGKITRPHGILGELKVQAPAGYLPIFGSVKRIFLRGPNGATTPYKIRGFRVHQEAALIKLIKVADRNAAEALREHAVLVDPADLPPLPEGQYYTHQLVGMQVQHSDGTPIGILNDVLATGSNDVYVVNKTGGGELLLPAIESVIKHVDLQTRVMTVVVPEGLE